MAKRAAKSKTKAETGSAAAPEAPAKAAAGRTARGAGRRQATTAYTPGAAKDRHLVIVESPSKAKTINKYLGRDYLVLASVGHVRDLPSKNPKGIKNPVPGVDLEHDFKPTYEISDGKDRVISDLKRAAKETKASGHEIWFATDLDREGEAIAWHLAQELSIPSAEAKRVVFPAITKAEIERAFKSPHPINEDRVNAQQARRILDRIVGYQVSPLLWKKVARGLSAGRVQSVAVRLVVEREREIRAFLPDEYWAVDGVFTADLAKATIIGEALDRLEQTRDPKGNPPTVRTISAFLADEGAFRAELVEYGGAKFDVSCTSAKPADLSVRMAEIANAAGLVGAKATLTEDPDAKGPAKNVRTLSGRVSPEAKYKIVGIETRRTTTRPSPPFITSTLQQAGSTRLGFGAQRTMRAAQQLYEGIDIPGEGPVGLITYMRTDSTHLSGEAVASVREYIQRNFGARYLPEKPNAYSSSNKDAQEAHEAIRPSSLDHPPAKVRKALTEDQFKLYTLIWERFLACQMSPAEWDATAVSIRGGISADPAKACTFRATGRVLVFDGHYKATGVPRSGEEQTLPPLKEQQPVAPVVLRPEQKFTSPPARYTEASLIKVLESEGIGRPSTYASIISVIQERKYAEQLERRFYATDLGEVVTDKLVEAFPEILDVGYTRDMEKELDQVEDEHLDWIEMLRKFYGPFRKSLELAELNLKHAKAEATPAPYTCPKCGGKTVFKFGKNGRFLSCATYPACDYASPVDRDGKPRPAAETVDVACIKCGAAMTKRTGRFGPFLGCSRYNDKENPCDGLLNLDKKGKVTAPSTPPLLTTLPCGACQAPLNLRNGLKGPWLSCSRFPKCRGRGKWNEVEQSVRDAMLLQLAEHEKANPVKVVKTMSGRALTDVRGKPLATAPAPGASMDEGMAPEGSLEAVADEMGM
ncbi:MAG: type I DNA topoisomerase [Phycisphaerales bacterium]